MKTYYLVRHGASTADSAEMDLNGVHAPATVEDIPLADIGREEAARAGEFFARLGKIDAVFSSPLARTYDTAKIIADRLGIEEVQTIPEVREVDLSGVLNFFKKRSGNSPVKFSPRDLPLDVYRATMLASGTIFFLIWLAANLPNNEKPDEVEARLEEAFGKLDAVSHDNVVVVTHGFFLTFIAYHFLKKDISRLFSLRGRLWVPNCSVTKIVNRNGDFRLRYFARDDYDKMS